MKQEKTLVQRAARVLGAMQVALLLVMVWAVPARADEVNITYLFDGGVTLCYLPKQHYSWDNRYDFLVPTGKVTKIKVADKAILGAGRKTSGGKHYLVLRAKKAGTTKLSFVYQGKSHTVTIVNKKYTNPCKKIALDSANITKKFNDRQDIIVKRTAKRKITVVPKAGWKIEAIYCLGASGATKQLRNGGKIPAKCKFVWVNMLNTSANLAVTLNINGS